MQSHLTTNTVKPGMIRVLLVVLFLLLLTSQAFGQQSYVSKYDFFAGYTYLNSPKISLSEPGFHIQAGTNPRTWLSMGIDYARATGNGMITPDLLPTTLQQTLGAQLAQLVAAGIIPASYTLKVPVASETQNFAAGPQLSYRHFKYVTLFIRPSIGAIRETATPKPTDPIATKIVQGLTPHGSKTDWTGFYGVGGGADLNFAKHFALRVQADFVRDHLFNDILKDSRNTVRFSIGPSIHFGPNIVN